MTSININTPLTDAVVRSLKIGQHVSLSGEVICARDPTHQRIAALIEAGEKLPFELKGAAIYYAGPTPARPGHVTGPVGPTTSGRMDPFTPLLLENGLKATIGKGYRSAEVKASMIKNCAVYLTAVGGAAALIAKSIKSFELLAYPELRSEALYRLQVEDFPAIVTIDCEGNDLYEVAASGLIDA